MHTSPLSRSDVFGTRLNGKHFVKPFSHRRREVVKVSAIWGTASVVPPLTDVTVVPTTDKAAVVQHTNTRKQWYEQIMAQAPAAVFSPIADVAANETDRIIIDPEGQTRTQQDVRDRVKELMDRVKNAFNNRSSNSNSSNSGGNDNSQGDK